MKEESRAKTGRKPKSDPADYKYSFRLNAGENMRFEKLVTESEAKDKTRFIKKAIFGGTIKVVKIDKATMDYYIRALRNFTNNSKLSVTTTIRSYVPSGAISGRNVRCRYFTNWRK